MTANHSTGPRTEAGKAVSSRNSLTLGLYTRADYVKPEERDLYKEFTETMYADLAPESLLEQTFAAEIAGASWRLRRCDQAEAEIADFATQDPYLDETKEKTIRSIERARAAANSALHRSINQLRRLQTERACRAVVNAVGQDAGLSDYQKVMAAHRDCEKLKDLVVENHLKGNNGEELGSICKPESAPASPASATAPSAASVARNALCPCRSGEKYKRCCGRNAPPVLNKAA